jgi:hypothetical protein
MKPTDFFEVTDLETPIWLREAYNILFGETCFVEFTSQYDLIEEVDIAHEPIDNILYQELEEIVLEEIVNGRT